MKIGEDWEGWVIPPQIVGSGMSNKMWEALLEHVKTCVVSGKLYVYYPDETRNIGVTFSNIYELTGLIAGEHYQPIDSPSDSEKVYVDTLVKKAYDNWNTVVEYDGKLLPSFKQLNNSSQNEFPMGAIDYPNFLGQKAPQHFSVPVPVPSQPSAMDLSLLMPDEFKFKWLNTVAPQYLNYSLLYVEPSKFQPPGVFN